MTTENKLKQMQYNFDEIIDRENTNSFKYDFREKYFGTKDILPMWVADMDFKAPKCILEAIHKRTEHGIFGYSLRPESYYSSIINWMKNNHNWEIKKDWIIDFPGVVPSINMIVQAFTKKGDKILVQSPVYYPFFNAITDNKRELINNQLILENGQYKMDLESLKEQLSKNIKMFILCSPHNPGGRVWTKKELLDVCQICVANNVLIVSDEIHSDIVFQDYTHIPTASLSKEIANNTITCTSASKTFNIAALASSSVIISNKNLRADLRKNITPLHIEMGNIYGIVATEAAYNYGKQWLDELIIYLKNNLDFISDYLKKNIPQIRLIRPEATYLAWLDFRNLNLNDKDLKKIMIEKAKVGFNDGTVFGNGGSGFQRMNFACPKQIVKNSLEQIEHALLHINSTF